MIKNFSDPGGPIRLVGLGLQPRQHNPPLMRVKKHNQLWTMS